MKKIGLSIRLRPVRFGFLVRPNDAFNLQRIFEANTCLWGGMFNPIIPYFEKTPTWWSREKRLEKAREIIEGYINYYEPDYIVETEKGFCEKLKLPTKLTLSFDDFMLRKKDYNANYGLDVQELYNHLYQKEYRYLKRDEHHVISVKSESEMFRMFVSCIFGSFPTEMPLASLEKCYRDVFAPHEIILTSEQLNQIYENRPLFPIYLGSDGFEREYHDSRNPVIFILDASKTQDLIDFWNLRTIRRKIRAIPIQWFEAMSAYCRDFIMKNYSPYNESNGGTTNETIIYFSRSLTREKIEYLEQNIQLSNPDAALFITTYPHIWNQRKGTNTIPPKPILISKKKDIEISLDKDRDYMIFDTLSPEFVEKHEDGHRWANVVNISDLSYEYEIASVFPLNYRNLSFPHFGVPGDYLLSSTEGLTFYPNYIQQKEHWAIYNGTTAMIKWLESNNIKAEISGAGKTLLQMLHSFKGIISVSAIANPEMVQLLNKMAHKQIHHEDKEDDIPKEYNGRTTDFNLLKKTINDGEPERRKQLGYQIASLNECNVIRLGLEVKCIECGHKTWYSLDSIRYKLICENCLEEYSFPVGDPTNNKLNWSYRLIGPFNKPDYAQGCYTSALVLRFFGIVLNRLDSSITLSTSLNMSLSPKETIEADFLLWYQRKNIWHESHKPTLVFGEAKSFGKESFLKKDIGQLKKLALKFPGSVIVFATMKDCLTKKEKAYISSLALWGREITSYNKGRAYIVVLTGTELFSRKDIKKVWTDKGGMHAELIKNISFEIGELEILAEITQQLYLDLPTYHEWRRVKYLKKKNKRLRSGATSE